MSVEVKVITFVVVLRLVRGFAMHCFQIAMVAMLQCAGRQSRRLIIGLLLRQLLMCQERTLGF